MKIYEANNNFNGSMSRGSLNDGSMNFCVCFIGSENIVLDEMFVI